MKAGAGNFSASGSRFALSAAWEGVTDRFRTAMARPDSNDSAIVRRSQVRVVFMLFVIFQ